MYDNFTLYCVVMCSSVFTYTSVLHTAHECIKYPETVLTVVCNDKHFKQ